MIADRLQNSVHSWVRVVLWNSLTLSVLLLLAGWVVPARAQISYIQGNSANPQTSQTSVTVPYTLAQTAGNLNVVVVGWNDSTATVKSVTDSKGNTYAVAAAPVIQTGVATQAIYYAKNIVAASAGANTVTVTFSTAAKFVDIRIAEYTGIDTVTPVDVSVGAQGNSATSSSGPITTTNANDLLVGANLVQTGTNAAGTGFTKRVITNPDGDILEDQVVTTTGSYSATAAIISGQWVMQMVAFRAAASGPPPPDTIPPTTPTNFAVMPPVVQAVQGYINTNLQTTHTTAPFDSTGGDLLVVCASSHAGVTMTPSDNFNNTWISGAGPTNTTTGFDLRTQVWYAQNPVVGPGQTFTLNLSAAQSLVISIIVVKGSDVQLPIDAISLIGSDNGTQTTNVTSPNITTTSGNELLIGFAKSSVGETFTSGSGFTAQPAASSNFLDAETGTAPTPGAYNATFTLSTTATWQAVVLAVRPSAVQMSLSWTASSDPDGDFTNYLLERCQGPSCTNFAQIATPTATIFTDTGLTPSTSYSYRVRATDTDGNFSGYSNTATGNTGGQPATAPGNLSATSTGPVQINLGWTASTETGGTISQYLIERCTGSACTTFVQVGTSSTTSFSDSGLSASTTYTYRVRAQDTSGVTGPYSNTASATTTAPVFTAPSSMSATAASPVQINLSWAAATETGGVITQYLIERCTGASCTTFSQIATVAASVTTFSNTGLTGSTSYSYRVRATDGVNFSAYSNTGSATTLAPTFTAPSALSATAASSTQISLSWTAATETGGTITQYLIERCSGAACTTFSQITAISAPATSFTDNGASASTSYSYRVRVTDGVNFSAYSNTASATTPANSPTAPGSLSATASGPVQINLSWTASTETGGTISQYLIERCTGASCTTFSQITTVAASATSFSDTSLTGSTSYSYRVRAQDSSNVTGPYSNTASATTAAPTFTAPSGLTASATTPAQINLSWTAATETGGTITQYLIERCSGASCTTFTQIGTVTASVTTFNDTGLTGSTSYTYRVRASDGVNFSAYSTTASATTPAPTFTAPSGLSATAASNTQINLSWTAATETGGTITQYLIERCTGLSCSSFGQVGTSTSTSFSDTGLTAATSYSYRVRATDAASNFSAYSNVATAVTNSAPPQISYVQGNSADPQTSPTSVTVTYTAAQNVGDLNVVVVGWNNSTATVGSVTDTKGNSYAVAAAPVVQTGLATQVIYYAKNIAAATAGANTVTVTFSAAAAFPDIRIAEYSGIDTVTPVDVSVGAQGSSATSNSGPITTTNANDLLVGANVVQTGTNAAGTGFTKRIITNPDGDILEDQVVTTTGSYSATAAIISGQWVMQMVAFRAAGSGPPQPISVSVSPASASVPTGYGTQGFTATLQNDSQNLGVTWALSGTGCSGTSCGILSSVTTTSVTYNGPSTVPNPATVTLTATSIADTTKSNSATITVTQGTLHVAISPKRGAITTSQTQQFTATVTNDPQNGGVIWSVDGINGGAASNGTITSTGLFTPGTQAGLHVITATSVSNTSISASVNFAVTDLAGVFLHHNDTAGTGQNLKEYGLAPATVSSSTFGMLFSCPLDGYTYARPLYMANLSIGGVKHNVVFLATEHDSVYAFDADSSSCSQIWKVNFLSSGVTTMPWTDTGANPTDDVYPEIGITSTPVIDPSTNTIYVEAKTKETVGSGCSSNNPCYVHRLHALDVITGAEKFGGPVVITAPNFVSLRHFNRPGLILANNTIYIGFGSHGDIQNWQGWLFGYDPATLAQKFVWSTTDATSGSNGGALWGGGSSPTIDANGNVYVSTGNGTFNANTGGINYGDSVVKLSPSGTVLDYFTPFDQSTFDANDIDLGSVGVMILPDAVGSSTHQHLALATGKVGILYLLDQTNLGKFNKTTDQDLQEVTPVPPPNTTNFDGGIFGSAAYWNGNIYVTGVSYPMMQFTIANGVISTPAATQTTNMFPLRGAIPAVSANGTTGGVVWVLDLSAWQTNGAAILDAYDATNLSSLLYSSPASGTGAAGPAVKFTIPTVANGKVYVGGQSVFTVFGLLPN